MGRAIVRVGVFLMDEPFAGLDAAACFQRAEIAKITRIGAATIFTLHDQAEVMTLADHIDIMSATKNFLWSGTIGAVKADPWSQEVYEIQSTSLWRASLATQPCGRFLSLYDTWEVKSGYFDRARRNAEKVLREKVMTASPIFGIRQKTSIQSLPS